MYINTFTFLHMQAQIAVADSEYFKAASVTAMCVDASDPVSPHLPRLLFVGDSNGAERFLHASTKLLYMCPSRHLLRLLFVTDPNIFKRALYSIKRALHTINKSLYVCPLPQVSFKVLIHK